MLDNHVSVSACKLRAQVWGYLFACLFDCAWYQIARRGSPFAGEPPRRKHRDGARVCIPEPRLFGCLPMLWQVETARKRTANLFT